MRIVVDKDIPFIQGSLDKYAEVFYVEGQRMVARDLSDIDMLIIRTRTRCNEQLLHGSKVRYIFTATIGTDHIDLDYCAKQGIEVRSAIGCNVGGVAQYVIAAIQTYTKKNHLQFSDIKLGIVGVGNVGKKLEQYARALNMQVLLNDPPRAEREKNTSSFLKLDEVLEKANVISFHTPLSHRGEHATVDLIDSIRLNHIQPNTLVINSSRGEIIQCERAFRESLQKKSCPYVLDVWRNEPHIDTETLEQAWIGTPHIAGYSMEGKWNATRMALDFFAEIEKIPKLEMRSLDPILLTCSSEDPLHLLEHLIGLYHPEVDALRLKTHPNHFECLRNEYSFRREYGAYHLNGCNYLRETQYAPLRKTVEQLDFILDSCGDQEQSY